MPTTAQASTAPHPKTLGLAPLFFSHAQLFIADILNLSSHPDIPDVYLYDTHPIRKVNVMGVVTGIEETSRCLRYIVDDGTGSVPCVKWKDANHTQSAGAGRDAVKLGMLVNVRGRVTEWREREIMVNSLVIERDPNREPLHWLTVLDLKATTYSKPFTVPSSLYASAVSLSLPSTSHTDSTTAADRKMTYASLLETFQSRTELGHEDLARAMELYVQTLPASFAYSLIRTCTGLRKLATRILQCHSPGEQILIVSETQVDTLISRSLHKLVTGGVIYLSDPDLDLYTLVRPALKAFVLEILRTGKSREEETWRCVRDDERFKHVKKEKLRTVLADLVEESEVWEASRGEWKAFSE
ncbi:hypothetical protein BC832DRAFT_594939 [Gaertneriomyces semiglobifer]|nr:hypothetical protein BC832DRAFT_594939 [Gaertneriomyces semiglobifer]